MDTIRSWIFSGRDRVSFGDGADNENNKCDITNSLDDKQPPQEQMKVDHQYQVKIDPKVAEYFKDFPEPYKSKAITRFSSREGLYQWDFYRDYAMNREFQAASRGEFLEDKRERGRQIEDHQQTIQNALILEKKQAYQTREQSTLEKAIRRRIPVHEDETLGLKLFQTANFSLLGFVLVWSAITLRRRRPATPKWQHYMTLVGSSYVCVYLQTAAVYRLMDWGPFDRSVDNRDVLTKQFEEVKNYLLSLKNDFSDSKTNGNDGS